MAVDREALARAVREARENSGMSQEAAAKREPAYVARENILTALRRLSEAKTAIRTAIE